MTSRGRSSRRWKSERHGRGSTGKRGRAFAIGLTLLVVFSGLLAPVVSAHVTLDDTTPDNGGQLTDPPTEVTLRFSGTVETADVTVTNLAGERVSEEDGSLANDTTVSVPVGDIGDDVYTVTWEIIAGDGHPTSGSFTFVVSGSAEQATPTEGPETTPTPTTTQRPTETATEADAPTTVRDSTTRTTGSTSSDAAVTGTTVTTDRTTATASPTPSSTAGTTPSGAGTDGPGAGTAAGTPEPQSTTGNGTGFGSVVAIGAIVLTALLVASRRWRG